MEKKPDKEITGGKRPFQSGPKIPGIPIGGSSPEETVKSIPLNQLLTNVVDSINQVRKQLVAMSGVSRKFRVGSEEVEERSYLDIEEVEIKLNLEIEVDQSNILARSGRAGESSSEIRIVLKRREED